MKLIKSVDFFMYVTHIDIIDKNWAGFFRRKALEYTQNVHMQMDGITLDGILCEK